MGKLTVAKVRSAKPGRNAAGQPIKAALQDGDGLFLIVTPGGAKSWMLRVQVSGKRRDIGLGAVDTESAGMAAFAAGDDRLAEVPLMLRKNLSLAEAREKAAALRKLAKAGGDPKVERDRLRVKVPTFAEAVTETYQAFKSGWSERTAKAFKASLEEHANPKLGQLKVDAIGSAEVVAALAPIWTAKPVMARKVRSRIGQVLALAKSRGWRADAPPDARELRGGGLSNQPLAGNFEAMPYQDCPGFFASEWGKELTSSRAAMLFALLTGNRSGSVRNATWDQIDLEAREWHCPPENMKSKRAHDVALSDAAVALLRRFQPDAALRAGLIFPGAKRGRPLSDMSLTKILRLAGREETVHGWRTSFRSWAGEQMPHIPWNVAELAISHRVGTTVEKAYNRADYLAMRRALFDGWGLFVAPALSGAASNVTPIRGVTA